MNIISIIVAILGLGFLIFFHELGHFLAAKLCHVGVLEFSIGMGPRILSRVIGNTRYSLKLLPLGGSCAMLGEDSAGSGDFLTAVGTDTEDADWVDYDGVRFRSSELKKYSFQEKPAPQRFLICIAGVLNNFLLAFLLAAVIVFFCGYDRLYVMDVSQDAPVASAGFETGDRMVSIGYEGGHTYHVPGYRDLYIWLYVHAQDFDENTVLTASVIRDGSRETLSFRPYYDTSQQKYKLGISFYGGRILPSGAGEFLEDVWYEVSYNTSVVIESLQLLFRGRVHRNEVMGPVGAVTVMGSTVDASAQYGTLNAFLVLVELLVMLTANLGVMNLLPVPALDGGRLLFILLEMISGRRLNPKLEERINQIGMILLLILMALVMSNDVLNLLSGTYAAMIGNS